MINTVTIVGVTTPVEIYAPLAAFDDAITSMIGDGSDAWIALIADDAANAALPGRPLRGRIARSATVAADRQNLQGTPTGAGGTSLHFPATGVVINGLPVDSSTVPPGFLDGVFALAAALADDPTLLTPAPPSNLQIAAAGGGVEVEFFETASGLAGGIAGALPAGVAALFAPYLASASPSGTVTVTSDGMAGIGSSCSQFTPWREYSLWRPD